MQRNVVEATILDNEFHEHPGKGTKQLTQTVVRVLHSADRVSSGSEMDGLYVCS